MPASRTALVYRPLQPDRLRLRMPFDRSNRSWLHQTLGDRTRPIWNGEMNRWEIARAHFSVLVRPLLDRFGQVDVTTEHSTNQRCDLRCRDADGKDCTCSCFGEHHGGGLWGDGWTQVGQTTLVRSGVMVRHMRLTA
ncbi:hypothetical protein ABT336_14605 [Micromonospora sp. NPDC000207]|uniref:hypothetical protein n=1 Tax=Micromonospora sp. NPDC000207 TaxID=3154246 RepID=UPI0033192990